MEGGRKSGRGGWETVGAAGRTVRGNMVAMQKQWRTEVKQGEKRDGGLR